MGFSWDLPAGGGPDCCHGPAAGARCSTRPNQYLTRLQVGGQIAAMGQLLGPLQYEVNPFADPPRFPIKAAFRAARLCRRAMNIITAFAITSELQQQRKHHK